MSHGRPAKAIGDKMRQARNRMQITQERAAAIIGVRPSNYSQMELGYHYPSVPMLLAIAKGLQVPAGELLP